ncbi:MAG: 4-(cytidine 5'-diphospho)-2-C-methyl-D-erythritol kinase [Raineya sp.]|nr:4-(cytidine 5'-diphospho)-2-C-methyl-D-erythritol kinase [Raineya sp.]MDW8296752.1 4-(cytidine 5'-diphospho)-2-C-methyl-D-erythritol kinase [Raineya sp.]
MITFPNAKINLGLYITEKRPDGYHNLVSCFYPVGVQDVLEILPAEELDLTIKGLPIDTPIQENLCYRTYQLLAQDFNLSAVRIILLKNIPMGAGLGGGSADVAFLIKMLNEYFNLHLSTLQMQNYASRLGSDCAFFIENKPKICLAKGDVFMPTSLNLQGKKIVVVYPNFAISTAEAYKGVKPTPLDFDLREKLEKSPIQEWKYWLKNQFEEHLFEKYPILAEIKSNLYAQGALYASMTGSGSAVYGIFENFPAQISFSKSFWVWQGELY